ncbi:MAG: SH3 domain-containing protein [Campylobacterota bacterium]|nr:SH3 domain-containing protein [Campylobacterota bacterium]
MYNPTEYLLESLDPMKKIREDMQRAINPMYDINKSLYSTANIMNESLSYLEPLKSISSPWLDFQKEMEYTLNPMKKFYEEMELITNPMKKLQEDMEKMLNPISSIQKQLDSLNISSFGDLSLLSQFTKSYQKMMDSIGDISAISKYQDTINSSSLVNDMLKDMIPTKINQDLSSLRLNGLMESVVLRENDYQKIIQTKSTVEFDEAIILEELTIMKEEVTDSLNSNTAQIEEFIEKVQVFIVAQKNPYIASFFLSVIFTIIINLMSSTIYDNIKPNIDNLINSKQYQYSMKKEITKSINQTISNSQIKVKFRIVKADVLNVRYAKSIKSKIISNLNFGEVVEIVKKEKNWCLIKRYDNESETSVQGWVSTRYLARVR